MKKIAITLLAIFLAVTSGLCYAAEENEMMPTDSQEEGTGRISERPNLSKSLSGEGEIIGIVMLLLVLFIAVTKYTRSY